MSSTEQRFQSFLTRIRPHRVAILANSADPNWYHNCIGIIEFLTKLWGGSHCVIVPTDGKVVDEEFWAILSAHDPDIFYRYQPTGADLKVRAPEEFAKLVFAETTKWSAENGVGEDQARSQIEKAILEASFEEWAISDELRAEILKRIAPFHFARQPLYGMPEPQLNIPAITKGSKPAYPLTPMMDVLRAGNRRSQVTKLGVNDATESTLAPPKLWLAATIGCGDDEYFQELFDQQITPVWTTVDERVSLRNLIKSAIRPWRYTVDGFPLGMTTVGLTAIRTGLASRHELPTIVVVGSSLKDFCLYFNLYWQQGRALWLPPWFMPEEGKYPDRLVAAVFEAVEAGRGDHNDRLVLVSYSVPHNELLRLSDTIRTLVRTAVEVRPITTEMVELQMRIPSRIYADGDLGNTTTHMLLNNSLPGWFESPVPQTLNPASPLSHRWIVDVAFIKNHIPRHPVLGRIAIDGPNVGDVRAGLDCISYMCPGVAVFGDHMETNILRISIHVPDADEIFRVIVDDCGYQSKTSDKGRYESATVQKFGDLGRTGYALSSSKHRALLEKYLDRSESRKGVFDQGVLLKDRRRYLDFQSMQCVLESPDLTCKVIDEYVEKEILYRGFVFVCTNCSDAAWHSIADVDQTFTCQRCGLKQQYRFANWKRPSEPAWYYKLDEMVYLMLEHNGHVPLLTLDKLRTESKESFLFRPELRLSKKGATATYLEIDLCCIIDGKLCIGEAKSKDSLEGDKLTPTQTVERYRDLALAMGASIVVFSTSARDWNQASLEAIRIAFARHPHIEVRKWTSSTLYD